MATALKTYNKQTAPLNFIVNQGNLYIHPPSGPHVWAGAFTLATDSLLDSIHHQPGVLESVKAAEGYLEEIANIRICDNAPPQIKRLISSCDTMRMGPHRIKVMTKQGPGSTTCRIIDYPATWAASPTLTADERTRILNYMLPAAQKPENRDHLANIAAASQGIQELENAIALVEGKHVRRSWK